MSSWFCDFDGGKIFVSVNFIALLHEEKHQLDKQNVSFPW